MAEENGTILLFLPDSQHFINFHAEKISHANPFPYICVYITQIDYLAIIFRRT
jgi:hypothetical protein